MLWLRVSERPPYWTLHGTVRPVGRSLHLEQATDGYRRKYYAPHIVRSSSTVTSKPALDTVMTAFWLLGKLVIAPLTCLIPIPLSKRAKGLTSLVSAVRTYV